MKSIANIIHYKNAPLFINDSKGNNVYYENSDGKWQKREYDSNDNQTYFENSDKFWIKREFDSNAEEIYYETSYGDLVDERP